MKPVYESLKEYIESDNYFTDARKWYKYKYIRPFTQRSFLFILSLIIFALFIGIAINISSLFPTNIQIKYSVNATTSASKSAQIIRANKIEQDSLASITDVMIKNYILNREKFNYADLKKQFTFVKNNSTRIVFRRFYNAMSIDNPSSPVLKYQKDIKRTAKIISATYPSKSKAIVTFNTIAKDISGLISENIVWQATLEYEIDEIEPDLPPGSRFNFTITDYQLKIIEDKGQK